MTQDKDQMRAEFEALIALEPPVSKERIAIALHKDQCGNYTNPYTKRDWEYWSLGWQAARASAPQGVAAADWWRKRADEIELQVAQTGSTEAMRCFTDMRTLLQSVAAPQPVALMQSKR